MRSRRRSPKGGVLAEKQRRYVQLIEQGIDNAQACRIVGINRKTGTWDPRCLSVDERVMIADLLAVGDGVRAIGRKLGRAASTISREVRRNGDKDGRYRPHHAEQAARARAGKPRKRRIVTNAVLGEAVCGLLAKRWSPEQVAHELRELLCGERARWLCPESIYQAIYDPGCEVTRPARRRRRRRRLTGLARRGRLTAMRMIDERPPEVADRVQAGHWEGDLIMGADAVREAIGTALARLPEGLRRRGVESAERRLRGSGQLVSAGPRRAT